SAYTLGQGNLFPVKISKASVKKLILIAIALACLIPAVPAAADSAPPTRAQALAALKKPDPQERRRGVQRLEPVGRMDDAPALIGALRDSDERVRELAEEALWAVWSRSGDASIDDLLRRGVAEMSAEHLSEAIAIFTRIIELRPDFAEGWNKRATVYYLT